MSAEKHARECSFRFFFGAAVFAAALAACEQQGTNEEPATPVTKARTQDKTEVKMEVSTPTTDQAPTNTSGSNLATTSPSTTGVGGSSGSHGSGSGVDPEDPNIGGVQDAATEKSIAPIRPRLRACYKKALISEPSLGGNATFDVTLSKDGKVVNVRFVKRDGLNEDMVGCLLTSVKHATFDATQTTKIITFTFGNAAPTPAPPAASADAGPTKK